MSKTGRFVSRACAAELLNVSEARVELYAIQRLVGVQKLPDLPPRYDRQDLLALRDRSIIPAATGGELAGV